MAGGFNEEIFEVACSMSAVSSDPGVLPLVIEFIRQLTALCLTLGETYHGRRQRIAVKEAQTLMSILLPTFSAAKLVVES